MHCYFCKKDLKATDRIGRSDTCPHCDGDLHICKNCEFYDPNAYNECYETQAERVVEKESSNFCDYFAPSRRGANADPSVDPAVEAKRQLEEMFKK